MKKLIALAVAALPMAAMADVTLYGNIEASIENGKSLAYLAAPRNRPPASMTPAP